MPHNAITNYINHYTKEGDIILDAFSGSGMTGIAAQQNKRKAILLDLSPFASFLSSIYNNYDVNFKRELLDFVKIVDNVSTKFNWLYETEKNGIKGNINYFIINRILICPFCNHEMDFWDVAVDEKTEKVNDDFNCPSCNADLTKKQCSFKTENIFDKHLNKHIEQVIYNEVLLDVTFENKERKKVRLDDEDIINTIKVKDFNLSNWIPTDRMPDGDESRRNDKFGFTHIHHFYSKRTLIILSEIYALLDTDFKKAFFTSIISMRCTLRMPYRPGGKSAGTVNNLNIPSLIQEYNVIDTVLRKAKQMTNAFIEQSFYINSKSLESVRISNCSATSLTELIPENSIDYIFTDPPFGSNIMYSELSFFWESWLKVLTNNKKEAIVSKTQEKGEDEYHKLIYNVFKEYYKVLKPNRWITIEFHNSKSSIWNVIQEAIIKSGFIISNVGILNKKQGSFTQVTSPGAVEKDLVISAYKPSVELENKFLSQQGKDSELDFISSFLKVQPIKPTIERTSKMLYSKLISYYILNSFELNYNASDLYSLLKTNFYEEDGYWFTSNQLNSYIEYKKKMKLDGIDDVQTGSILLFVSDERSAILWLFNFLQTPKSFSEIHIAFTQIATIQDDEIPELTVILEDNFIKENNIYRRPTSKEEHDNINIRREKALIREFESLLLRAKSDSKKIKEVRKEALIHGFEVCYKNKRFKDIIVLSDRLDDKIIQNNSEINDFVEAAKIMVEGIS